MAQVKRVLRVLFARAEVLFDLAFGRASNPLTWLGALGWYFFWIVAATGIYLYIFFDTGITQAYASVEYMTHEQWYAAGIMRSLHRYASDALVIVVALHILREFSLDRLRGRRFFAWVTGVPLLWFLYICGISGYWLVWDQLAQYIAIATSEWLDTLPMFGAPIADNFLNGTTLGDRFFTLMVFIHIFGPLFMLLLMWVHIQRHARARVNPPKDLAIGTAIALTVLSVVFPAVSQPPADLDVVPALIDFDWYYLVAYTLLDTIPGGQLWLILIGLTLLLMIMPWLPPLKPSPAAVVDLDNCNGCARCFEDCPFGAITMQPRSDDSSYDLEAVVSDKNCISCGACVGACPTATPFSRARAIVPGIELPGHPIAALREKTLEASSRFGAEPRILVYACENCSDAIADDDGTQVLTMPCVSMLPPPFIDFALSRKLADGVVVAGCGERDCYYRLGDEWVRQRVAGERDPYLRKRVPRERLRLSWRSPEARREKEIGAFRDTLSNLGNGSDDA
jgi:ferredoxin/coenzyme F420-reducing hydrogenase delta subunit